MADTRTASTKLWVIIAAGAAVVILVVVWALLRQPGGTTATPGTAPSSSTPPASAPTAGGATAAPSTKPSTKPSAKPTGQSVPPTQLGSPSEVGSGKTVSVKPVKTKEPVPLDDEGDFGTGLSVELTKIQSVKGEAKAPGEIAGPALKITLRASNDSKKTISVDSVTVAVFHGEDRAPAIELSDGRRPLAGDLKAGDKKNGVYLYNVPTDVRDDIRVEVSYSGQAPTVAFEGSVD